MIFVILVIFMSEIGGNLTNHKNQINHSTDNCPD